MLNTAHEVDHPLSPISSVAMGYGCCIVSGHVGRQTDLDSVVFKPVIGMRPTLGMCWRDESDPTVQKFVEYVIDAMHAVDVPTLFDA